MIVLVTGGRTYGEREGEFARLSDALQALHIRHGVTCVVEGGAPGADTIARGWAGLMRQRPTPTNIRSQTFRAEWDRLGAAAGPARNARMVSWLAAQPGPTLVLACPGGRGTADCVRKARAANLTVKTLDEVLADTNPNPSNPE